MTGQFKLRSGLFLYPTPAGAYQALTQPSNNPAKRLLTRLLRQAETPPLTVERILRLTEAEDENQALAQLHHCQKLGWIQGLDRSLTAPQGALENLLPPWLEQISDSGDVLLADEQGFYLACSGFPHEAAEELSALSADLRTLHQRRAGLLINNLGVTSQAWAIVDAFGHSQIGFWPIFIGQQTFVIAIAGLARFNRPEFVSLSWTLMTRYAHIDDLSSTDQP